MTDDEKIGSLVQCGWHKHTATAFARAGGRCEYCGRDLLHDRLGYAVGEMDHLLPRAQHPQLVDCPDNWILSCRLCNSVKRDWDPAPGLPADQLRNRRDEFVKAARAYIYEQRVTYDHDWLKVRKIMDGG